MYDELIGRLKANGKLFQKYIPNAEGEILLQAAEAIEELVGKTDRFRWIPVTERLPLYGQDVLAVRTYGDGEKCQEVLMAHIAVWDEGTGEKWWNATNITHWMPLPEPPGVTDIDVGNKEG